MKHTCTGPDACSSCERAAEARVEDAGYADDWQIGQDRYERELDARWGE
jgi:hypothetical protein